MVARWIKVFPKVERSRIPSMEGGQWRQIEREHPDPGNNDKGLGRDSAGETTWEQGLAVSGAVAWQTGFEVTTEVS